MKILSYHKERGLFWVRLFGYGFLIKRISIQGLRFSQRNRFKGFIFKDIFIEILK